MIVRPAAAALHLITQPDHAALSRRIMERWVPLADHSRRASVLLAIGEHDNGWREPDGAPALDRTGRVVDFVNIPVEVRQGVWPRGVARLAFDPWAAALVAQHAITVYSRFRPDAEWATFFERMAGTRNEFVDASRLPFEALLDDYTFVRLGDLLSLTFCTGWTEPQHYDRWTVVHREDRVVVAPDGFGGREVPIAVAAVEVSAEPFMSEDNLRAALAAAPRVTLTGTISRA
jgi:hypothetical protein